MTVLARGRVAVGLVVWATAWLPSAHASTPPERSGPADFRLDLSDSQREQLTEAKRAELITQLETLVQRFPDDSPRKPDLLFQLGEAYWEKSKALRRAEIEAAGEPSRADHRQSEAARARAMDAYARLLKSFPRYPRRDEVMFSLAYDLEDVGRSEEAAGQYRALLRDFPRSRFAPDAWLELGNRAFDAGALAAAQDAYQHAGRIGSPRVRSYATYKLAWCDFNLGDFEGAREKLARVVDGSAGGTKPLLELRTEALVDLTRVYVRLDRAEDGLAYFQRNTQGAERRKLVGRLAKALAEAGDLPGALGVYQAALAAEPLAPEAAGWQQAVVQAWDGLHDREKVRVEARKLAGMCHPGTAWWKANAGSPQSLRAGFEEAEEGLRTLVTAYHQEAQRTGSPRTYRLAAEVYQAYLAAFARDADPAWTSDHAFDMSFYAAEIAWALGDWRSAAEQYERVVDFRVPDRPTAREASDERYRATAAYDAVLAWDRVVDAEHGHADAAPTRVDERQGKGGLRTRAATAGTTEVALTEAEQRLVAACDRYADRFPDARDVLDIRYQAALVLFERGHTPAALERFAKLIALQPDSDRARQAADLTLNVLETRGDWLALNAKAQEYARNGALARSGTDFARRVGKVAEASRYAWVSDVLHAQQHQDARAAEEFLRFADDYPRSDHAAQALTFAMALLEQQGQLQRAVEVGRRALAEYPGTPLRLKLAHGLADLSAQLGDFRQAAEASEAFVAAYARARAGTDGPRIEPALLEEASGWVAPAQGEAGLYWAAVGRTERAIGAYQTYLQRFSDRKDASDVALALGHLQQEAGRLAAAARAFEKAEMLAPGGALPRRFEALGLQLRAWHDAGQPGRVKAVQQRVRQLWAGLSPETRKEPAVVSTYAQVALAAADPLFEQYRRIDFAHARTVKADLARKRAALKSLENAYLGVVTTGDAQAGIAALTRIGEAYSDFAAKIRQAPTPPGLTPEDRARYRDELEQLAAPLEQRSLETLEKGLAKAYELGAYGTWTLRAQDDVDALRPGSYPSRTRVALRAPDPALPPPPPPGGDDAREAYLAALRKNPDHLPSLVGLARLERQRGRAAQATELLERAARRPALASEPVLWVQLSLTERMAGDLAGAEQAARRALSLRREPGAYEALALVASAHGRDREAELLATTALRLDEARASTHVTLGLVAFRRGEIDRAHAELDRAVALDPSSGDAWTNLGALALGWRDYRGAERAYRRASELEPWAVDARLHLAEALAAQGEDDPAKATAAAAAYREVLTRAPERPEAICGAGWALARDRSSLAEAGTLLRRCRDLPDTSPSERRRIDGRLSVLDALARAPAGRPDGAESASSGAPGASSGAQAGRGGASR
ncbi:MAG TPA: tetratricopeptide repeat protein [Myxococcaceae bacterium]|nr:tetratricopeptide repeat protein [Myxococcaceae bacterium]